MSKPPETKISKAQYKTLLRRAMDKTPVANQQSQALQMQQMLGMSNPMDMMGGQPQMQSPMVPQMQPQMQAPMQPQMSPEVPAAPSALDPAQAQAQPAVPNIPATQDMGSMLQRAAQVWQEIENGLGGQLWSRLSQSIGNTEPDQSKSFVQAALAYQQNPEGIENDRVKQFLASLFPDLPSAVTSEGMQQEEDPLVGLINQHLE